MTTTPPETPPVETPPADPPKGFQPITSQEELDRALGARLAREREKFADYGDLKTKAAEYDKALEAAKTEQEKAVEAARREGETSALERANSRLVAAEARALAAEARFHNPALAARAIDLAGVAVDDSCKVDVTTLKARLKELADAEPYLVDDGKRPAPKPDRTQGGASGRNAGGLTSLSGSELYERLHPKTA